MINLSIGDIDRGLEKLLEKALIEKGWHPDKDKYFSDLENAVDEQEKEIIKAEYLAIIESLKTAGTFAKVYGVGNYKDRLEKKANSFVINRGDIPSSSSNTSQSQFCIEERIVVVNEVEKVVYDKYRLGSGEYDIAYSITMFAETSESERTLTDIITSSLGIRKYFSPCDSDRNDIDTEVFIERSISADVSGTDYIEKVIRYIARNVNLENSTLVRADIPQVEILELGFEISKESILDVSEELEIENNL